MINIIIYGAGEAGRNVKALLHETHNIIAFIDDDKNKIGSYVDNVIVLGRESIAKILEKYSNVEIIFAISSISIKDKYLILEQLKNYNILISMVPIKQRLTSNVIRITDLESVNFNEIISRAHRKPNFELLSITTTLKNILISGGGGSIGSEIASEVLKMKPKTIIIYEISEFNLYKSCRNLEQINLANNLKALIIPILGSISDDKKLEFLFEKYRPDTVFHAAAYKHVKIVEQNPLEGFKNNFLGTISLLKVSLKFKVNNFVLISSDKAVNPSNIMGITKRLCELYLLTLSKIKNIETSVCAVRFGNVINSSGSVIPLFYDQIKSGGPVTVTHPDATRYFMTITEAAQLVIQASGFQGSGNIYTLDMGDPIRILDLANCMIDLFSNKQNIDINYIGLSSGEKIHEELSHSGMLDETSHPAIKIVKEEILLTQEAYHIFDEIQFAIECNDIYDALKASKKLIPKMKFDLSLYR